MLFSTQRVDIRKKCLKSYLLYGILLAMYLFSPLFYAFMLLFTFVHFKKEKNARANNFYENISILIHNHCHVLYFSMVLLNRRRIFMSVMCV